MNICEKCNKKHDGSFGSGRFCSRSCANKQIHSLETKEKISKSIKRSTLFHINNIQGNITKYNNGVNKKYHSIIKLCPICNISFFGCGIFCSKECYNFDISNGYKYSKKPKNGGYRQGSGRGKSGWYKGIFCNSTYELAWVIYNLDHNISFTRNQKGFPYTYEENTYKYYPDFILSDNSYIEIKGYKTEKDSFKISNFPHPIKILEAKDLIIEFTYVRNKYGIHIEELYEGNPHNQKLNKCKLCGKPAKFQYCSRSCCGIDAGSKHFINKVSPVGAGPAPSG